MGDAGGGSRRDRRFAGSLAAGRTRVAFFAMLAVLLVLPLWPVSVSVAQEKGAATGLPLPRFVSLKASKVNLRKGPGTEYPTAWVFRQAGLPVEVIREFETWRQVRDADGTTGWVIRSLLSNRRTVQVLPWDVKSDAARPRVEVRKSRYGSADAVAIVEAGVLADVHSCDAQWCDVTVSGYRGYIEQKKLWGVYAGERLN